MTITTVFLRDDDVGANTKAFRDFIQMMVEERVPCNYQVVPAHLQTQTIDFLRELHTHHADLIVLNQHGLKHEHTLHGRHTYREFGGGRSFVDQYQAITQGKQQLEAKLGSMFTPTVFTPPCHAYDENTLKALAQSGFKLLSAGFQKSRHGQAYYRLGQRLHRVTLFSKRVSYHAHQTPVLGIAELSAAINVNEDLNLLGKKYLKYLPELTQEFERARKVHSVVGVMFHHANYITRARLDILRSWLRYLKQRPDVRIVSMEQIAADLHLL